MKKKLIAAVVVLAVAAALGFLLFAPNRTPAPAFHIQNLQGQTLSNADLNGKVTLLNFWFPSCPGCVSEMPKLIQTAKDYQNKPFQIIGIAVPVDSADSVRHYASSRALPFAVAYDGDRTVTRAFVKTELYPTSVLLDKQGNIIQTFVGEPDFAQLYQQIDTELTK
ncbi:TlpA family protein disulfide reductase [Conchiformibius steedae DSM 2580]|uniref:TlpA family protein disulfide reductase n=1 Tax=Conchiformibius steedae DSM 2580 TaxID=1121352 RepID=A0AAE9I067_9NEIS|nr:TlpA disulfide reductase family protein [Conchiformibius steedae]QMT33547.1 TlpA family protein disulfide reductase [Conchiformibius steedae]URD68206.1 TlpA family protein disulfide reductase [Conchiformibius steedae DSM 2580]